MIMRVISGVNGVYSEECCRKCSHVVWSSHCAVARPDRHHEAMPICSHAVRCMLCRSVNEYLVASYIMLSINDAKPAACHIFLCLYFNALGGARQLTRIA
jgi:hypothetical protein